MLSDSNKKNEELQKSIEQAKQIHGKSIHEGFIQLGINIPIDHVLKSFDTLNKLGVTNVFLMIDFADNQYLVRINGKLWPPYQREDEKKALSLLKTKNIETNILFESNTFQICKKPDDSKKFSNIIANQDEEKILQALHLVSLEVAKYHQLKPENPTIHYPLEKMLTDAKKMLFQKFSLSESMPVMLNLFGEACDKLVKVVQPSLQQQILSHNDLLPSSIFVDFDTSKVSIVDWEYSALSYWSNDLGLLAGSLTMMQRERLFDSYSAACGVDAERFNPNYKSIK